MFLVLAWQVSARGGGGAAGPLVEKHHPSAPMHDFLGVGAVTVLCGAGL